jgi:hypothetical protein
MTAAVNMPRPRLRRSPAMNTPRAFVRADATGENRAAPAPAARNKHTVTPPTGAPASSSTVPEITTPFVKSLTNS